MTSLKKIAATLLERRHRMTHVVLPGDLISQLGSEGMQEALRRTWLVPDMMSGSLTVNCNLGIVAQMEDAAKELCEDCKKEPCECKPAVKESQMSAWETMPPLDKVSRAFVVQHAERLHEFAAPGSGQGDRPAPAPTAQPTSIQPNSANAVRPMTATNAPAPDHNVGDGVIVAEEGKTYAGRVKARSPDGTYEISFGSTRPTVERRYRKEEMQTLSQDPTVPPGQ
jgi:hypothetical protein